MPHPRVISLLASVTEIVCLLGQQDKLVGRSHECDFPPSICELPLCTKPSFDVSGSSKEIDDLVKDHMQKSTALYNVDFDLMNELQPDLVLTQSHCEVCAVSYKDVKFGVENLISSKPKLLSFQPNVLADLWNDFHTLAEALHVSENASPVIEALQQRVEFVRTTALKSPHKPKIACIEWMEPLMGAGNWIPELVSLANAEIVCGHLAEHSPWITWEDLVKAAPEIIIVLPCGFDLARTQQEMPVLIENPLWQQLPAVNNQQVFLADGNQFFNRSGPRLVDSLEILAEIIQPELFDFGYQGKGWIHV